MLEKLAKEYAGIERISRPMLAEVMIEKFRRFVDTLADNCASLLEHRLKWNGDFRKEVRSLDIRRIQMIR